MTKKSFCVVLTQIIVVFCFVWPCFIQAQQALNTSGGIIPISDNNRIEFSMGEVVTNITGNPGLNNYFTAGVIQPWYALGVNMEESDFDDYYYIRVYPNPVSQSLKIETNFTRFQTFQFTNMLGEKLRSGSFDYSPLKLQWMVTGVYILTLTSDDRLISKTIKIVKQ